MTKLNTQEFIDRAKLVHNERYVYDKVKYTTNKNKVEIICSIHGNFLQTPNAHLAGAGCPECGGNKRITTEEFIHKAQLIHESKYTYEHVQYINANTKVMITCLVHGEFLQSPYEHSNGSGCPNCLGRNKTTEEFILEAKAIHKNKYLYDKVEYVKSEEKVTITCKVHGDFEQSPYNHLSGKGCTKCAITYRASKKCLTTEEFISRANIIHGDKYDYTSTIYKNRRTKINILCPVHGIWSTIPFNHISVCQAGCPQCSDCGFDMNKPAYLYYLKITTDNNQILYKIGITNRTVDERFNPTELKKIEIIKQKLYDIGQDAYDWEQKLLKMYKQYQYNGPKVLVSGNTELFTMDILKEYYESNNIN